MVADDRRFHARLAELTGRELGLGEDRIARLRVAMLICDLGQQRIAVNDEQELGRARLDPALLEDIRAWILARRERPDGRGQPRGLTRDQIPVEAKILSVVDAYVSITTDLPHRPAKHEALALRELLDRAGSQFDARVVTAFIRARPRQRDQAVLQRLSR
jgi:HD-GYP domain-containing protein (c-di-GMP phosphodiesterase class II)